DQGHARPLHHALPDRAAQHVEAEGMRPRRRRIGLARLDRIPGGEYAGQRQQARQHVQGDHGDRCQRQLFASQPPQHLEDQKAHQDALTRGSNTLYSASPRMLAPMYNRAPMKVTALITGRSEALMALMLMLPSPGIPKKFSSNSEPVNSMGSSITTCVSTGIMALGSTWRPRIRGHVRPLARAVTTYSLRISSRKAAR